MSLKILVLDDEPVSLQIAVRALSVLRHDVQGCGDPSQARERLRQTSFDIIVLDLQMPGIDGVDMLRWVRGHLPFMRVITMTAGAPVSMLLECWRLGADGCVLKGETFIPRLQEAVRAAEGALELWERSVQAVRRSARV